MENILIICAMEKEAKFIAQKLNLIEEKENLYKKENITLLISGIGKQRTAICLAGYLCQNEKPSKIINIGYSRGYRYTSRKMGKYNKII